MSKPILNPKILKMVKKLPDRPSREVFMALEEFSHSVNFRSFQDHLRKMILAYLQADEDCALYDYSRQLWGELDELFTFLAVMQEFQIAAGIGGEGEKS